MPKILKVALICQLLILALIAQALASVLTPNAAHQTRRLSLPAIDSASTNSKSIENDRDIAAAIVASDQSANTSDDDEHSSKVKSSQEGDVAANASTDDVSGESESAAAAVKSTKLLPALSNSHAIVSAEHKSSAKLVLNRVESQSDEVGEVKEEHKAPVETLTNANERDGAVVVQRKEESVADSSKSGDTSGKDEKSKEEKDALTTERELGVFSQAEATLQKSVKGAGAQKYIDNGLDVMELQMHAEQREVPNIDTKDEPTATTEEILKDLEEVVLLLTTPATQRTHTTAERTENETDGGNKKEENMKENHVFMGRSMDGAQSSENKLEEYFRGKLLKEETPSNRTTLETDQLGKQMSATAMEAVEENIAKGKGEVATDFETTKIKSAVENDYRVRGEKATDGREEQQLKKPEKIQSQSTNTKVDVIDTTAAKTPSQAEEEVAAKTTAKVQEAAATKAVSEAQEAAANKAVSGAQEVLAAKSASQAKEAAAPNVLSQAEEPEPALKAQEAAAAKNPSQAQETLAAETTSKAQAAEEPKATSHAQETEAPEATSQAQAATRLKPNNKSSQSPAEKRAKFISENSTNSQNMNLPDGSVAWSLASMRMLPKGMNNTNDQDNTDTRWQMNEIVTTERTMNISGYSEKNLLDWTKVMGMRGELEEATMGTMEKNHLTEGILQEQEMKNQKTHFNQEKLSETGEVAAQSRDDTMGSEPKTQLTTEGIVMLKENVQTTTATQLMNEVDTNIKFSSESTLSADKYTDLKDTAITADEATLNKTLSAPDTHTAQPYSAASPPHSAAPPASTEAFSVLSAQQTERSTGVAAQQLSTTQESKAAQNQPSDDFNFIVTSTTPVALLEVTTAGVTTTMPTANEANMMATTTTAANTPTTVTALPVEHSSSTTLTTSTPSDVEATKRWDNAAPTELKVPLDETSTQVPTVLLGSDAGADVSNTKVDINNKSNNGDGSVLEQHLKREPVTETETVEQNTLLTVSKQEASKAHGSLIADERNLLNLNASASARENGTEDIGAPTTIQNVQANVATETTTESAHIATTIYDFINTPTTTLLSSTNDLVNSSDSVNKTSEVQTKETEPTATTEVGQIGNEVELEVRTTEHNTGAAVEQTDIAKRLIDVAQRPTESSLGPIDVETATTNSNNETGSSAHKVLDGVTANDDEPKTRTSTEKTVVSINELLIPVNTTTVPIATTTPTTAPPTQQTAVEPVLYTATTPKSKEESANEQKIATTTTEQASGSLDGSNATTSTTFTPVDFLPNHAAEAKGAHDTESSFETNDIDQLDKKTTVKSSDTNESRATSSTTINALDDTTAKEDVGAKETTAATSDEGRVLVGKNESKKPAELEGVTTATTETTTSTITTSTSTSMASVPMAAEFTPTTEITKENNTNSGASTTTTEPPLISLLDDSTTTTRTPSSTHAYEPSTSTTSDGMKPEEVYTIFSTTESTTTEDATSHSSTSTTSSTAAITTQVPNKITTTEDKTSTSTETPFFSSTTTTTTPPTYIPTVASTIFTVTTTTMLPPPTLHASIGGGSGGSLPTHLPDIINAGIRPSSNDANETDVNVIIAITVSVIGVVALILLVAFLYLMRKRQKQMSYGQRCRPVSLDAYSLDNVSVLGSVRRKGALRASKRSYGNIAFDDPSLRHNTLTASELAKFVERRSSIFEEFRDVPQIIARADEIPPGCEDKNRYANVIPLPETRVVLQQLGDDDKTEYINANYVRGPKDAPNYYIATQAPLETTVTDFWRMIWEQQSRVIIQATDLYENGIEKCAEYLPPSVTLDNHTTYGDFQITLKHREVKDKYAISTLMLKNTSENMSRELTHYWYKWPETGVPHEEAPIIAMLLEARSSLKGYVNESREKSSNVTLKSDSNGEVTTNGNGVTVIAVEDVSGKADTEERGNGVTNVNSGNVEINGNISAADKMKSTTLRNQGPLTIHCSPGTGRTGTIIACDMAIRSLETPKRSVDIPQIVYYVRRGRASAVQTKEQYEFIYKVAHMYATKITNLSNDN